MLKCKGLEGKAARLIGDLLSFSVDVAAIQEISSLVSLTDTGSITLGKRFGYGLETDHLPGRSEY